MEDKKPLSQSAIALILVLFFFVAGVAFWYKYQDVVAANPYKYLGYVVTLIFASQKEIFKRDETTNKYQLQSLSHWILPVVGICAICLLSVSYDVREAFKSATQHQTEESNHKAEEADHRAEIADLKRLLAEQKFRELVSESKMQQNQAVQIELAKRTRLEDQRQAEETRDEVKNRATDQRNLIVQKNIEDFQRSVRSLHEIQTGFQQNERGFRLTGEAINRSVNQIEKVSLTYQIILPLQEASMSAYRAKLTETIQKFLLEHILGKNNDPANIGLTLKGGSYIAVNGKSLSSERVEILPNSPIYPSAFDGSFQDLLSYPLFLKIKRNPIAQASSTIPVSDLNIETHPGVIPNVYYFPADGTLRLVFANVIAAVSKNTGNIWSSLDLNNSQVDVTRNTFDYTSNDYGSRPATQLQKTSLLTLILLTINNSTYCYSEKDLSYHQDATGSKYCSFIFNLAEGRHKTNSLGKAGDF